MKKAGGNEKKIKEYWDTQARTYKGSALATNPDLNYRALEMRGILSYLKDRTSILDVGCGNGYSTLHFARKLTHARFVGIDYSKDMINSAAKALGKEKKSIGSRVSFAEGNALTLSTTPSLRSKKFDYIISERCIINLANWKEQQRALFQMKKLLKRGGRIILTENTQEGLARLNGLRKMFSLKPISVRWHNYYMSEKKLLAFAKRHFHLESMENIGNLYYIISRVVYAKLAALEGKEPDYAHPINTIASRLPSLGSYQYSPNFIFVLRNT